MEEYIIHTDQYVPFYEIELTDDEIAECMELIKESRIREQ